MIRLAACVALIAVAGCQQDPFGRSGAELRTEEQQCMAEGGDFRQGGLSGAKMCFLQTKDSGKSCQRSTDCESLCLISEDTGKGQCAAEKPLFGCFDMLDENGERIALCID